MNPKEKIIVTVEQNPLLLELELPELLKEYAKLKEQEDFHAIQVAFYGNQRTAVKASIGVIINAVKADSVVYTDPKGIEWRSTMVRPESSPVLDPSKLRVNMGKIGKLAAPVIQDILMKSTVPGKPKASYVRVSGGEVESDE